MGNVMEQTPGADRKAIGYVARLDRRDGSVLAVTIRPGNRADATEWMAQVQPDADRDESRADRNWDWPARVGVNNTLRAMRMTGEYFVLTAVSDLAQKSLPIGIMTFFGRPSFIPNPQQDCLMIWHFAAAPRRFLTRHFGEGREPRRIGHALVDTVVTRAFQQGLEGRVVMHAHPDGGDALAAWCAGALRMHGHAQTEPLPRAAVYGRNDGRWFFYTTAAAAHFSRAFDKHR